MLAISMSAQTGALAGGKIVVDNDEWTLSDAGFANASDTGTYALNVADWFTGGGAGNFLAYSSNFGSDGGALATTMTRAGYGWTISTSVTFDLPTLLTYDGVFLAGDAADTTVLANYVRAGGNVYLAGGTGWGGAYGEAAQWNPFLNQFGLAFDGSGYNGISGNIEISSTHPIFDGVSALFQDDGSDILDVAPGTPGHQILVSQQGHGLYAVAEVPEPSGMIAAFAVLAGMAGMIRRRK